ncbi:hypothetical protein J2W35_006926 [Variovorax boronicumulans]|uniref:hypothetical protein n=1 Tax=Variovorax boronicumulans TaxID=436515 RepID=UPI002788CC76|nr:hypothetical protein [Variovorax boronicumulans]MDQ0086543.1 hypothetical protein [Variovorax boronicumulans]
MKALKSELAKRVLADPNARAQLRDASTGSFTVTRKEGRRDSAPLAPMIVVHDKEGRVIHRVTPTVVPKAA